MVVMRGRFRQKFWCIAQIQGFVGCLNAPFRCYNQGVTDMRKRLWNSHTTKFAKLPN